MRITFIGGGNMASAIISGLCQQPGQQISVVELHEDKRASLQAEFGVTALATLPVRFAADEVLAPFMDQMLARYPAARWYARNISSSEDFDVCVKTPGAAKRFVLFQGAFLTAVRSQSAGKADASQMRVLEIMRLLRAGAETQEIDAQFKLDSVLLFKLLRFINSPANGLSRKVMSIEESLLLLGRESLFKWLTLLLFTSRKDDGRSVALLERSLFRARFMETLGKLGGNNRLECEHLFLSGMFSLLDALMHVEMASALSPLDLPPTVADALLNQRGMFAPYLALAISAEQDNADRIVALAELLSTTRESVARNLRHLEKEGLLIRRDRWHCQLTEPLVIDTPPCAPQMPRVAQ